MSYKNLPQVNRILCADCVALLFTEYPKLEGASYETVYESIGKYYGKHVALSDLVQCYTPFYEDVVEGENDFFEGYSNG